MTQVLIAFTSFVTQWWWAILAAFAASLWGFLRWKRSPAGKGVFPVGIDEPERVVADYMAGMTDRYALDEYKKLFDPYQKV